MVVNGTVVGPFEEEEEGTGITSDVVKVKGEDPATPGLLPEGIDPGTVTIPQYRVNKTKQHTHTAGAPMDWFLDPIFLTNWDVRDIDELSWDL